MRLVYPASGATNVDVTTNVVLMFDRTVDHLAAMNAFVLRGGGLESVPGSMYIDETDEGYSMLHFTPSENLQYSTEYTILLYMDVVDPTGATVNPFMSTFTTMASSFKRAATLTIQDPVSVTVKPGQTATWAMTVTNTGSDSDTFQMQMIGPSATSYPYGSIPWSLLTFSQTEVNLAAGDTATVTASLTIPSDWKGVVDESGDVLLSVFEPWAGALDSKQIQLTIKATTTSVLHLVMLNDPPI